MVSDKDVNEVMKLLPQNAVYYFTQAQTHRAIPAEELAAKQAAIFKLSNSEASNLQTFQRVEDAVHAAQKAATDEDIIFIGGSNYVVGEALTLF